jgi:class 3 adenylate cyclase
MSKLRTTVIVKTDLVESTPRVAGLSESELTNLLNQHKRFISEIVARNEGRIIRGEGDAFWITFPSVTAAVLNSIDIHQHLRTMQAGRGEKNRLAIRVVISMGDVLHEVDDMHGYAMSLTARIEKITPPDEIYLSHAAWLILNKAEVPTTFVDEFVLKGISQPERIYKVEQKHRTRSITDQYIVFTDVRRYTSFVKSKTVEQTEEFLLAHDDLVNEICEAHEGIIRNNQGDCYFLTFSKLDQTLTALDKLCRRWSAIVQDYGLGLSVGVHKGDVNILRSYVYGHDIHTAVYLTDLSRIVFPHSDYCVIVSDRIRQDARGTIWEQNFRELQSKEITDEAYQALVENYRAHQFIVSDQ